MSRNAGLRLTLWVVGKFPDIPGEQWEVEGLFNDRNEAIAVCQSRNYFVAPLECNVVLNVATVIWPGLFYPLAEKEP